MDHGAHIEQRRLARIARSLPGRTFIQASLAIALGIVAALVLPIVFGDEFATRKAAKFYAPVEGKAYGNGSRDSIAVLLIDDQSLKQAGQTWPASYDYYARLMRGIATYRPKAVFIDIVFKDARFDPAIGKLAARLCELQHAGIDVYLAGKRDEDGKLRVRAGLDGLQGRCFKLVSVEYKPDELDHLSWTYPLETKSGGATPVQSAAPGIYENSFGVHLARPTADMALSWGLKPAANGLDWSAPDTDENGTHGASEDGSYCRGDHGWLELAPYGFRQMLFHDAEKPVCVFHETLYARELANTTAGDEAKLTSALRGKVVMVATARDYSNDLVNTPINDRIPGVYLHAMALDNLLTWGPHYKHAAALTASTDRDNLKLLGLAALGLLAVVIVRMLKNFARERSMRLRTARRGPRFYDPNVYLLDTSAAGDGGERRVQIESRGAGHRGQTSTRRRLVRRLGHGLRKAVVWAATCLVEIAGSLALVGLLLYIGQTVLDVGFLSVVDIAVFALAAEWFEWNEKLIDWFNASSHNKE